MTTGYIDISQAQSPSEMLFLLSKDLETGTFNSKKIVLNMGTLEVNHSQLLSLKSLIISVDSEIDFIYTKSDITRGAALSVGISVANGVYREIPKEVKTENIDNVGTKIPMSEEDAVNILFSSQPAFVENIQAKKIQLEKEVTNSHSSMYISLSPETEEDATEIPNEKKQDADKIINSIEEKKSDIQEEEKDFVLLEDTKKFETVYVKQTIRSGQIVSHDGNVVIIGDCNPGSEIIASGDITVWGELKGIAHAGAQGNENAVIRALKLDAIQLRISEYYARRPDRANIEFVTPTDTFTPEEARVCDGEIVVFTMNSDKRK